MYDVEERALLWAGPMPLSRGATLTWLGFSDKGLLAAHDSAVRPSQQCWHVNWQALDFADTYLACK